MARQWGMMSGFHELSQALIEKWQDTPEQMRKTIKLRAIELSSLFAGCAAVKEYLSGSKALGIGYGAVAIIEAYHSGGVELERLEVRRDQEVIAGLDFDIDEGEI